MARQVYRQGEEDGSKLTNYALLCLCLCLSLSEERRKMKGKRGRRGSKGKKSDGWHFKQGIYFVPLVNQFVYMLDKIRLIVGAKTFSLIHARL